MTRYPRAVTNRILETMRNDPDRWWHWQYFHASQLRYKPEGDPGPSLFFLERGCAMDYASKYYMDGVYFSVFDSWRIRRGVLKILGDRKKAKMEERTKEVLAD